MRVIDDETLPGQTDLDLEPATPSAAGPEVIVISALRNLGFKQKPSTSAAHTAAARLSPDADFVVLFKTAIALLRPS